MAEARAAYHDWLGNLTSDDLEAAARALRGKDTGGRNCVPLAAGMLAFLRTRETPKPAAKTPNSWHEFGVCATLDQQHPMVKQEPDVDAKEAPEHLSHSTVTHAGVHEAYMPADTFYSVPDRSVPGRQMEEILATPGIDLTRYSQQGMEAEQAPAFLQALAHQCSENNQTDGSPATYGLINLGRAGAPVGHQLVYFAQPDGVMFIDCQNINGAKGKAVKSTLVEMFEFNNGGADARGFQTRIFVTPIYPPTASQTLQTQLTARPKNAKQISELEGLLMSSARGAEAMLQNMPSDSADPNESFAAFANTLRADPNDKAAYLGLGISLTKLGRDTEALTVFAEAVEKFPGQAAFRTRCGQLLLKSARHDEALEHFKIAVELDPGQAAAHAGLGYALIKTDRHDEALIALSNATARNPGNADNHYWKGHALSHLGRHEDALAAFEKALERDPNDVDAHLESVEALHNLDRHNDAFTMLQDKINFRPDGSWAGIPRSHRHNP